MRTKEEFRKMVAEQFTNVLEEKDLDWVKEWHTNSVPLNAVSNHQYRGINQFYLSVISMDEQEREQKPITKTLTKLAIAAVVIWSVPVIATILDLTA